jgi:hypothetical protein
MQKMRQALMWNGFIRFFIEAYFELVLLCAIRLKTFETDTRYEEFFTFSACAVFGGLIVFNY